MAAGAVSAAPQDVGAGRAHFAAGQTFYGERRFREAVGEFLEAYRLSSAPDLLYNIAVCYDALEDPGRATIYYQRYLALKPQAAERAEIEASLYRMSPRVAKLIIEAPPRSEVLVDGGPIEVALPAPLPVTAGKHRLEARRSGTTVASAQVTAEGGLSQTVRLDLVEGAPAERRRWVWPVVGVAAALVVGAVIAGAVVGGRGTDYRAEGRAICSGKTGCVVVDFSLGGK